MRQEWCHDYAGFAHKLLDDVADHPISLEVFSDDFDEMDRQARLIASWGANVYVKIPVTTTSGQSSAPLDPRSLTADGLALNVTAIPTFPQVAKVTTARSQIVGHRVGVRRSRGRHWAGPGPVRRRHLNSLATTPPWNSCRASPARYSTYVRQKRRLPHHHHHERAPPQTPEPRPDLDDLSLDTVRMFHRDAENQASPSAPMIITRTPLRITLGGGGTDLPSYYERYGGLVISAAIDKYIFITLNRTFTNDFFLKYSALERVTYVRDIEHPIIREAFSVHAVEPAIEMVSVADIPSGTGLGSSGAFTVGLLRAIYAFRRDHVTPATWPRRRVTSKSTAGAGRWETGSVHRGLRRPNFAFSSPPRVRCTSRR